MMMLLWRRYYWAISRLLHQPPATSSALRHPPTGDMLVILLSRLPIPVNLALP